MPARVCSAVRNCAQGRRGAVKPCLPGLSLVRAGRCELGGGRWIVQRAWGRSEASRAGRGGERDGGAEGRREEGRARRMQRGTWRARKPAGARHNNFSAARQAPSLEYTHRRRRASHPLTTCGPSLFPDGNLTPGRTHPPHFHHHHTTIFHPPPPPITMAQLFRIHEGCSLSHPPLA